jgi:hypothetical protein
MFIKIDSTHISWSDKQVPHWSWLLRIVKHRTGPENFLYLKDRNMSINWSNRQAGYMLITAGVKRLTSFENFLCLKDRNMSINWSNRQVPHWFRLLRIVEHRIGPKNFLCLKDRNMSINWSDILVPYWSWLLRIVEHRTGPENFPNKTPFQIYENQWVRPTGSTLILAVAHNRISPWKFSKA